MPVTKKKGAVFAIYADTPPRGGSASSSADTDSNADAGPSGTNTTSTRPRLPRPALSALQPAPTRAADAESSRSAAAKPAHSTSAVHPSTAAKPARRAASTSGAGPTAAFDVFVEDDATKKTSAASEEGRRKAAAQPLQPKASSSGHWGPPKRDPRLIAAAAARTARDDGDKENAPPPGSPAPRAPSKARAAIAVRGPANADDMASAKGKSSSTKTSRPSARIFEINPLADVSEAYGATRIEPDGFRDGRPVRWADPNSNRKPKGRSTASAKTIRS